jgi:hypothetical protein
MKRNLKFDIVGANRDGVKVRITEQSHRGEKKTDSTFPFTSKDGNYQLRSVCNLEYSPRNETDPSMFYLRGSYKKDDNMTFTIPFHAMQGFIDIVNEWNAVKDAPAVKKVKKCKMDGMKVLIEGRTYTLVKVK